MFTQVSGGSTPSSGIRERNFEQEVTEKTEEEMKEELQSGDVRNCMPVLF
jgi:hypothetical protein